MHSIGEIAPRILCSLLGLSLHEEHSVLERGAKNWRYTAKLVKGLKSKGLCGAAAGARFVLVCKRGD